MLQLRRSRQQTCEFLEGVLDIMTTPVKVDANRRNARRSTGPRTLVGKARSSKNAFRHGLLSKNVLLPDEDAEKFGAFRDNITTRLDPQGEVEHLLVDKIVMSAWRLGRVYRLEASLFAYYMSGVRTDRAHQEAKRYTESLYPFPDSTQITDEARHQDSLDQARAAEVARDAEVLGDAFVSDSAGANAFSKLARYETTIERGLFRAMHELERLQAARAGQSVSAPVVGDVDVSSRAG